MSALGYAEVPLGRETPLRLLPTTRHVVVILERPSNYDSDGFPYEFFRGVLPSNSLKVMARVTKAALVNILPADVTSELHMLETRIGKQARELRRLHRRFPEPGVQLIVGLTGVMAAEFSHACDRIRYWQKVGATCVIGGFHVSGMVNTMLDGTPDTVRRAVPCPHTMPADIQALMDSGAVVFTGEAEVLWQEALADILSGQPKALYRGGMPAITATPLPEWTDAAYNASFATRIDTIDASRGCPRTCTFCTVIWVQGRIIRFRDPYRVIAYIKEICEARGKADFFFTDDNFSLNKGWEIILDGFAALRAQGYKISFMIQADLACYKIPRFLEKLALAGCSQLFVGTESVNPANLASVHKHQNKPEHYKEFWDRCHELGMLIHAAYIIGFPFDTPASIARDVRTLIRLGADQVSFFNMTPLPGSEDYARAVAAGVIMDPDLNRYTTYQPVTDHPNMDRDMWIAAYRKAWRTFYTVANMVKILSRCKDRKARRGILKNFIWYLWSIIAEDAHPMTAGFIRLRHWHGRRPASPPLSRIRFWLENVWRLAVHYPLHAVGMFYRFQEVLFAAEFGESMADTRARWAVSRANKRSRFNQRIHGVRDWLRLTFSRRPSRKMLNVFWIRYRREGWNLLNPINRRAYRLHFMALLCSATEAVFTVRGAVPMLRVFGPGRR